MNWPWKKKTLPTLVCAKCGKPVSEYTAEYEFTDKEMIPYHESCFTQEAEDRKNRMIARAMADPTLAGWMGTWVTQKRPR